MFLNLILMTTAVRQGRSLKKQSMCNRVVAAISAAYCTLKLKYEILSGILCHNVLKTMTIISK